MSNPRNHNNAINVVRRGKNYLEEMKNHNSGYQVRLPKLQNQNRLNHDYYMHQMRKNAQQGLLPPLVAGQAMSNPNIGNNYQ